MRSTLFLSLLALLPAAARAQPVPTSQVDYTGHRLVRVEAASIRDFQAVSQLAVTIWNCRQGPGTNDVQIAPERWQAFLDLNLPHSITIENVEARLQQERDQIAAARAQDDPAWFTTFHPFEEINQKLDADLAAYPELARPLTVGDSLENRPIRGIAISAPDTPANPRANRVQVLFNGGQHAREWASPAVIMYFSEQLAEQYATDPRVAAILNKVEVLLVPVMNPDGYVHTWTTNRMWRKNRRLNSGGSIGVDLNRNWGFEWGGEGASTNPANDTYRGPAAFSEPETQVLSAFITANPRIRGNIDFHSFGQLILSPWGYTSALPPDAVAFEALNDHMSDAIRGVHGRVYVAGPLYTTIYPASGGSGDWTYGARDILGYGWELRGGPDNGFILPPEEIIPTGEENLAAILEMGEWFTRDVNFAFPDGLPGTVFAGTSEPYRVAILPGNVLPSANPPLIHTSVNGGGYTSASLTATPTPNVYAFTLPAAACSQTISYYFTATSSAGNVVSSPAGGPALPYIRTVFPAPVLAVDFETTSSGGWTYGLPGDTATAGVWEASDPEATAAQPGDDNPLGLGLRCAVTDGRVGSGAGQYDVDGGFTTLLSPRFDARPTAGVPAASMRLSYARWYSNNAGGNPNADVMLIDISNDDGATWTRVEEVSENLGRWETKTFAIAPILAPTQNMRLRFIAQDLGAGSLVEAAIDDVRIFADRCPCPADFNGDATLDFFDYLDFVDAFASNAPIADFNADGIVDFFDYLDFVDAFSAGC